MTALFAAILGLLGVLTTSFLTYILAKRSKSGRIISSEAADLWSESSKMRTDLQSELERVRIELRATRADVRAADERATTAEEGLAKCQEQMRKFTEWMRGQDPEG